MATEPDSFFGGGKAGRCLAFAPLLTAHPGAGDEGWCSYTVSWLVHARELPEFRRSDIDPK